MIKPKKFTPPPTFSHAEFIARREKLISAVREQSGSGLIFLDNSNVVGRVIASRFRADSNFYYVTGFAEPDAKILISVTEKSAKTILFLQAKNKLKEIWDGELLGVENAKKKLAVDIAHPLEEFAEKFIEYIKPHQYLYYSFGKNNNIDNQVITIINQQRRLSRLGILPLKAIYDVSAIIANLRLIKSSFEIAQLKYACEVSAHATTLAMAKLQAGINESEIEAQLLKTYYQHQLTGPAFVPIVAGGKNACVLHYQNNNQTIPANSLTLIDAGGEYYGYCADITRTVPNNIKNGKKFSAAQKAVYEIVLSAHHRAIESVKAGKSIGEYHQKAIEIIAYGLKNLKLLKGSVEKIIAKKEYEKFYMHQAGHYLGLDTHDVGIYRQGKNWQKFRAGMVVTVEPGIYLSAKSQNDIPREFQNIGIRLEDDILVTAKGNENLTIAAPIEIVDIESLQD